MLDPPANTAHRTGGDCSKFATFNYICEGFWCVVEVVQWGGVFSRFSHTSPTHRKGNQAEIMQTLIVHNHVHNDGCLSWGRMK